MVNKQKISMGKVRNISLVEKPRGGNYLTDPQPKENRFHHIPEPHIKKYLAKKEKVDRCLTYGELKKEMTSLKEMLHINAIRIAGHSIEEGVRNSMSARESGLTPWMSPRFLGATFQETQDMLSRYIDSAIKVGLQNEPLIVANELSYDCIDDPVTGEKSHLSGQKRVSHITDKYFKRGERINCTDRVSQLFKTARSGGWQGPLAYAALADEYIDWKKIDDENVIVAVNLYWEQNYSENRRQTPQEYEFKLQQLIKEAGGRPFVLTEFGAVPQKEGSGGDAYTLNGGTDYGAQADSYREYLDVLEKNNVGYFAFAIDEPHKEYMGAKNKSYGIVLRGEKNTPLTLTPAGQIFADHNKNNSGKTKGVEINV